MAGDVPDSAESPDSPDSPGLPDPEATQAAIDHLLAAGDEPALVAAARRHAAVLDVQGCTTLIGIADQARLRAQPRYAAALLSRLLPLLRALHPDVASLQINAGLVFASALQVLGETRLVREVLDSTLAIADAAGDDLGRAGILLALGDLERLTGSPSVARQHYTQAQALYEQIGNDLGRANTLQSLGDLEYLTGSPSVARQHYTQAQALYEQIGNDLGRAHTIKALGDLEYLTGSPSVARQHYTQAQALYAKEEAPLGETNTLWEIGRLALVNPTAGLDAAQLLVHAAAVATGPDPQAPRLPEEAARACHTLAEAFAAAGELPAARQAAGRAVELSELARRLIRSGHDRARQDVRVSARYQLAARLALQPPGPDPLAALRFLELNRHRIVQELLGDQLRLAILRRFAPALAAALAEIERELRDIQALIDVFHGGAPPSLDREPPAAPDGGRPLAAPAVRRATLPPEARAAALAGWRAVRDAHLDGLVTRRTSAEQRREDLLRQHIAANERLTDVADVAVPDTQTLLSRLPRDAAVVFWALDETAAAPWLSAVVVRGDGSPPGAAPVQRLDRPGELEDRLLGPPDAGGRRRHHVWHDLREIARLNAQDPPAGIVPSLRPLRRDGAAHLRRLHGLLLAPLEPLLAGVQHVVMVPSGSLLLVPWAALAAAYDDDAAAAPDRVYPWLGRQVSVAYGLQLAHRLWGQAPAPTPCPGVTLRDAAADQPVAFGLDAGAVLVAGPIETRQAVQALGPLAQVFAGRGTERDLLALLRMPAALAHVVTHGAFITRDPRRNVDAWDSCLMWHGRRHTARQILVGRDDLGAPIILSSFCESVLVQTDGSGDAAESLAGLPRALLERGARAVVGSLWRVDDLATALLMGELIRRLAAEQTVAAALAGAQRWLCALAADEALARVPAGPPDELDGDGRKRYADQRRFLQACAADGERPFLHPAYWAAWQVIGDGTARLALA